MSTPIRLSVLQELMDRRAGRCDRCSDITCNCAEPPPSQDSSPRLYEIVLAAICQHAILVDYRLRSHVLSLNTHATWNIALQHLTIHFKCMTIPEVIDQILQSVHADATKFKLHFRSSMLLFNSSQHRLYISLKLT